MKCGNCMNEHFDLNLSIQNREEALVSQRLPPPRQQLRQRWEERIRLPIKSTSTAATPLRKFVATLDHRHDMVSSVTLIDESLAGTRKLVNTQWSKLLSK